MLNHLFVHLRNYAVKEKKTLYLLSTVILFWSLFDGIITYIVPIVITDSGISKTLMGIILGTSSVAGALFDFIACRLFRNTYYKKLFIIMFAICFGFPLLLFKAHSFFMFVIAMALWGVYYDLRVIGTFNYIGRFTPKNAHSESFGVLQVFSSIGYLVAPLIVGILIADSLNWQPFALSWIFLILSIIFFLILINQTRRSGESDCVDELCDLAESRRSFLSEAMLWGRVGKILFPVLLLTFFLSFSDAFFWTIGPLVAESLSEIGEFAGVFMMVYALPPLIVGWTVGSFTKRYGKKHTSFLCLFFGGLFLTFFGYINNTFILMADIFIASFFMSMAYPAINGAYADYISETEEYEKEIEGLEDFYGNLGYVAGPIMAGFMADQLGNGNTFSILGLLGVIMSLILMAVTPKSINVRSRLESAA